MEGAGWHFSHTEGKMVYGYQLLGVHMETGDAGFCYDLKRYEKDTGTKVEMSKDILRALPKSQAKTFVLTDSWYTGNDLFRLCATRNFTSIDAMKANRILYPNGCKQSVADYAKSLTESHFHPVTVRGKPIWSVEVRGPAQ